MVDGFTTGITIEPFIPGTPAECTAINCKYNVNDCQGNKIVRDGKIAGCQNNNINNPSNYSKSIKKSCPNVYSYAFDDKAAKYTCFPNSNNGLKISFYC